MRIADLRRPLYEELYAHFDNKRMSQQHGHRWLYDVYRNPSMGELAKLNMRKYDGVRAFIVGKDVLVWNLGDALHAEVAEELEDSRKAIPIFFNAYGNEVYVMVTDFSKRTIWHENRNTANVIRSNPYMREMFRTIEIGYYNEDIVGDWEEIYA